MRLGVRKLRSGQTAYPRYETYLWENKYHCVNACEPGRRCLLVLRLDGIQYRYLWYLCWVMSSNSCALAIAVGFDL